MAYDPAELERKWQRRWEEARLGEAEPDDREKFFMIFAYPGVSGYLHVGHMRGYTYTDVLCRYMRMRGYNVLFPVGTHATGNVSVTLAKKVEKGDERWLEYLRYNGCPEEEIPKLADPKEVVRFFSSVYVNDYWKRFGFLADWRRFTTTIDPGYQRFIQWQFLKLHELGLLVQKPYYATFCPADGPVAVDPSETDISRGGNAEKMEYTLLKFRMDLDGEEVFVVAATLRPETVFGQTNFWADPEVEYVKARVGEEIWIVSRPAAEKLAFQKGGVEIVGTVSGRDLMGKECLAPGVDRWIPILPSRFCDPNVGTGLVTSVPSDAPADWMGLYDLQRDPELCRRYGLDPERVKAIQPIPIIKTKGWGPLPAVEICEKMGIESQDDEEKLEEAKKEIYKAGFHTGVMNENCGEYAGMPVEKAKELVKERLVAEGKADIFYDLSEEVICRCGERVVIKRIDDQWFINYSNPDWTEKSVDAARGMDILPREYYDNMPGVLEWFQDRACVRMGSWLGTPFPLDDKWTIEPISDSTLYPIYYLISKYVNDGSLPVDAMTPEFFDYVFLGRGEAEPLAGRLGLDASLLERIRKDVLYWYPLDINLGGKEHMTVHFPVFLMNHVAILPGTLWPRGIFAHWYIVGKGSKISKSKGGAEPIPYAVSRFGVDAMRLFYCNSGSPFVDVEWDEDLVVRYKSRLERLYNLFGELKEGLEGAAPSPVDRWLESRLSTVVEGVIRALEERNFRQATNLVYVDLPADIRWYTRRGGSGGDGGEVLGRILREWALLMTPFTPHLAEELWEMMGSEGFASTASFPTPGERYPDAEAGERLLRETMKDMDQILRVTGITPRRILLYTAPGWKHRALHELMEGKDVGSVIKGLMADPEVRKMGKAVPAYVQSAAKDVKKMDEALREYYGMSLDEYEILAAAREFLAGEYKAEVLVFKADDPGMEDPGNKARHAAPRRPAIYVE
ncbi:MAG: leucine--tRNA ligase [Thermoplasmata archaeon]|nr:leucine--tRNA ligase [Thermoplasmata archaeon]